jgi:hypothetical protein
MGSDYRFTGYSDGKPSLLHRLGIFTGNISINVVIVNIVTYYFVRIHFPVYVSQVGTFCPYVKDYSFGPNLLS